MSLTINGAEVATKRYDEAGIYTLDSLLMEGVSGRVTIGITTDKPFQVPTDGRALGVVLTEIGFVQ